LNGQGYPIDGEPRCYSDKYSTTKEDFVQSATAWRSKALSSQKTVGNAHIVPINLDGHTIEAAMSYGHGVLSAQCGDCYLVRQDNKYLALMTTDVKSWSLELSGGAHTWLAADNYGGTCYIEGS